MWSLKFEFHSVWTCVGLRSQNDCSSLQRSFSIPSCLCSAVWSLCSARCFNQGSRGAENAVCSFSWRVFTLISPCLHGPAVSFSLSLSLSMYLYISSPLHSFLHHLLWWLPLMNFSLCLIWGCYFYISTTISSHANFLQLCLALTMPTIILFISGLSIKCRIIDWLYTVICTDLLPSFMFSVGRYGPDLWAASVQNVLLVLKICCSDFIKRHNEYFSN